MNAIKKCALNILYYFACYTCNIYNNILYNHKVNINFSQPKENDMSAFFFNKNHCTKIKCKVVYIWQLTIMLDLLDKHYKRKRFLGKNTFKAKMAQNMIINNI